MKKQKQKQGKTEKLRTNDKALLTKCRDGWFCFVEIADVIFGVHEAETVKYRYIMVRRR